MSFSPASKFWELTLEFLSPLYKQLRNIARLGFSILPRDLRHPIHRARICLNLNPSEKLTFKIAQSKEELEAAFTLLHEAYVGRGLMRPHPSRMRVNTYHALPSTRVLIALWNKKVVGTVSVIRNNRYGFPMDLIFDTSPFKKNGMRSAEISGLAIHKDFKRNKKEVLFPLLKFLYECCVFHFGVDYLLIAIHPRQTDFYEGVLFFEKIPGRAVKKYEFLGNAPAVGEYLNLRACYSKYAVVYGSKNHSKNLYHYFTEARFPEHFQFPEKGSVRPSDPSMSPELVQYFFNEQTAVFSTLSERDKGILCGLFDPAYADVLPKLDRQSKYLYRTDKRFEVNYPGSIVLPGGDRIVQMSIKNVSAQGLSATLAEPIRFGNPLVIHIFCSEKEISNVRAYPVWTDDGRYGFRLVEPSDSWSEFIQRLLKNLTKEVA